MITEINGTPYGDLEEYKKALNVNDYKVMSLNGISSKAKEAGYLLTVKTDNINITPERCYPYEYFSGGTINNYFTSAPNYSTNKPKCFLQLSNTKGLPGVNKNGQFMMDELGDGYELRNDIFSNYTTNDLIISQSIHFADKHNTLNIEFKNNTSGTTKPISLATGFTIVPRRDTTNKHTVTANTFTIKFNKISSVQSISNFNLESIHLNRIFNLSDGVFAPKPDEGFTFVYTVNSNTRGIISSSYGGGSQISIGDNHFNAISLGTMDTLSPSTNNTTPMSKYIFTNDYGDSAVTTFDSYKWSSNASGYTITIPYTVQTTINSNTVTPILNMTVDLMGFESYEIVDVPKVIINVGDNTIYEENFNDTNNGRLSINQSITAINETPVDIYVCVFAYYNPNIPILEAAKIQMNWAFTNTYSTQLLYINGFNGPFFDYDNGITDNSIDLTFVENNINGSGIIELPSTVEYKVHDTNNENRYTSFNIHLCNNYVPSPYNSINDADPNGDTETPTE